VQNEAKVLAAIEDCLGEAAVTYAKNKHRGGSAGSKGTRYEDFFLAVKVAEAAVRVSDDPGAEWPHIVGQAPGFVDDVRVATSESTEYFQLKNQAAVSWAAGAHPIALDFEQQYKVACHLKEPQPTTSLVVPCEAQRKSLEEGMPANIQAHSTVQFFPWLQTANRLVMERVEIRALLKKLAKVEEPSLDELAGVLGALTIGCIEHPNGANAEDVIACAARMYPAQVRSFPVSEDWERHLSPEFKQVLAQIPGLSYGAKRGFFHWSAFGTSGVFGWNCLSREFKEFQQKIVDSVPETFEDFERVLP